MSNLNIKIDSQGLAIMALNRPQVHNAFNDELIANMIEVTKKLAEDKGVRILALMGEGESFCAGADIHWMKKMVNYSQQENYEDTRKLAKLFFLLNNFPKPIIAKVHGNVLGGGVGLLAVSDFVLSSNLARFGLTEVRIGLIPAVISPYVVAKMGLSNAHAFFLSGIRFGADKAKEMGLVHQTCEADDLEKEFERILNGFLKAGPQAAVKAKNLLHKLGRNIDENTLDMTCQFISEIRVSPEAQEGMNALLAKRNPNWIRNEN